MQGTPTWRCWYISINYLSHSKRKLCQTISNLQEICGLGSHENSVGNLSCIKFSTWTMQARIWKLWDITWQVCGISISISLYLYIYIIYILYIRCIVLPYKKPPTILSGFCVQEFLQSRDVSCPTAGRLEIISPFLTGNSPLISASDFPTSSFLDYISEVSAWKEKNPWKQLHHACP